MSEPSNTFEETKNWLWVNQQEHVPLEADKMNIDSQIASLHTRRAICELIGNGTSNDGFLINDTYEMNPSIGVGDIFICGMKIEQPDIMTYNTQPYYSEVPIKTSGDGIYYLEVVIEQLDEILDPDIVDPAIGFPTVLPKRAKWRVKWVEDTATLPDPEPHHYHLLLGTRSGGVLVDQRSSGIVVAGSATGFQGREGGGLGETIASPQSCGYVVTVSKTGMSAYMSIQDAIDYAVTQVPTEDTPWVIAVCPGEYNEDITGANYVSLVGIGTRKDAARVLGYYEAPTVCSTIQNIMFDKVVEAPDDGWATIRAGQGEHDFIDCKFKIDGTNVSANIARVGDTGSGTYLFQNCDFKYNASGATPDVDVHTILNCVNTNPSHTNRLRVNGCRIEFNSTNGNDFYYIFFFDGDGPKNYMIDNNEIRISSTPTSGDNEHVVLWTDSPYSGSAQPLFSNNSVGVLDNQESGHVWHYWVGPDGILTVQNNNWYASDGDMIYCDGVGTILMDQGGNTVVSGSGVVYGSYAWDEHGALNQIDIMDVTSKAGISSVTVNTIVINGGAQKVLFDIQVFDSPSDWFDLTNSRWVVRRSGKILITGKLQFNCDLVIGSRLEITVDVRCNGEIIDQGSFLFDNRVGTGGGDKTDLVQTYNFGGVYALVEDDIVDIYITPVGTAAIGDAISILGDLDGVLSHLSFHKLA